MRGNCARYFISRPLRAWEFRFSLRVLPHPRMGVQILAAGATPSAHGSSDSRCGCTPLRAWEFRFSLRPFEAPIGASAIYFPSGNAIYRFAMRYFSLRAKRYIRPTVECLRRGESNTGSLSNMNFRVFRRDSSRRVNTQLRQIPPKSIKNSLFERCEAVLSERIFSRTKFFPQIVY